MFAQYIYNNAIYTFFEIFSFQVVFEYQIDFQFDWNNTKYFDISTIKDCIQLFWDKKDRLYKRLQNAQFAQAKACNKKIISRNFKIKNQIILFIKNLKNPKLKKKLFYKFTRLFEIEDIINL